MPKSKALKLCLLVFCASALACQLSTPTQEPRGFCGDGQCSGPEDSVKCPADCTAQQAVPTIAQVQPVQPAQEVETPQPPVATPQPITPQQQSEPYNNPVLYVGMMVHLEGWKDTTKDVFDRHAQLIRDYAALFEKYGAKLTLESKEFTEGSRMFGDTTLKEMEQRGHSIGVHADVGGQKNYNCKNFARDLRERRTALEALGVRVRHVSGNTSHCDWVTASVDAGYEFSTGIVAYNVMSLPIDQRPPEYRNCENPAACHEPFPADLKDRMHPWRARSGLDWLTDSSDGKLVLLPSDSSLPCLADSPGSTKCDFTQADVDAYFQDLDQALALVDPGKVNIFYVAWSLGGQLDKTLLEGWLQRLQAYTRDGKVEWKTLPEMYDAYLAWENR